MSLPQLILLAWAASEEDEDKTSTRTSTSSLLSPEDRRRRDRRTPRIALMAMKGSAFIHLFGSGDDQALLNCRGVDHKVFQRLLAIFQPVFDMYTVDRNTMKVRPHLFTKNGKPKGNKREITVTIGLAVVLTWFRTRGSAARTFSMVFGLTSKPLYKWLKYSRKVLLYVLQNHPDAIIRPPSDEKVEAYVARSDPRCLKKREKIKNLITRKILTAHSAFA